ncbi:hypothetical protein F5Y19DRAFT_480670 [Xylariaceae sp. FL1651]|nr:hypothetical protein F5Y19DRAFT_480670 [Xylariaceae sp. FL1651]
MPRPPRSRPAPTRPVNATIIDAALAPVLTDQQPADAPSSDIYDVSDREKKRAAARRKSLRDATSTRSRTTAAETIQQQKVLGRAQQRRDAAMARPENMTSTTCSEGEQEEEEEEAIDKSSSSLHLGQRLKTTPQRSRPTDMSGLDLDDDMFDDLNTTLDTVGHASAQRSAETSTLSATHFRRRPRAGSFLSRDDGPIRPSSRAGPNTPAFSSTLNLGVFKRRAREPSILSTAQKSKPQRPEPEHELERNDDEDEDEDEEGSGEEDFAPEAESTPLRRSKRRSGEAEPEQTNSSTKSRKRKSTEGHKQRIRSSPFDVDDPIRDSIEQATSDEVSPQPSLPPLPQERPSTPIMPPMDPELMAPPLSSGSSQGDVEVWPPLKSITKARTRRPASIPRRTPGPNDDVSNMSSPPSLTHSPNYAGSSSPPTRAARPKRKAAVKPASKVTTAELTSLLPRRQRRGAEGDPFGIDEDESEAEVDISGLGDGDDELAHLDVRARRRSASRASAKNQASTQGRSSNRNKGKPTPSSNKRVSRTYGRSSDKENQDEDEDEDEEGNDSLDYVSGNPGEEDSQMLAARVGEELKNAVRKFQEVDKWELSFEERTRSSSPLDAR